MRIAVCIFGPLRNFERTFPSLKKYVLDPTGADVFFCGHPSRDGYEHSERKVVELYAPKAYILREITPEYVRDTRRGRYDKFHKKKRSETILDNMFSHFRNVRSVDELRRRYEDEHGFCYDAVMFVRPDVYFFAEVPPETIRRVAENPKTIVIPAGPNRHWDVHSVSPVCVSDRFVLAHRDTAATYATLDDACEMYVDRGATPHPETLTGYHVLMSGLERVDMAPAPFAFKDPGDPSAGAFDRFLF